MTSDEQPRQKRTRKKGLVLKLNAQPSAADLRNNYKLAVICQFVSSFAQFGPFSPVSIDILEQELLNRGVPSPQFDGLVQELLRKARQRNHALDELAGDSNSWESLGSPLKIDIAYALVDEILFGSRLKRHLEDTKGIELRIDPVARDGQNWYYLLDNNRVYKLTGATWTCLCWTLEGWREFLSACASQKSRPLQGLARYLRKLLPVIEENERLRQRAEEQHRKQMAVQAAVANRKRSSRLLQAKQAADELAAGHTDLEQQRALKRRQEEELAALEQQERLREEEIERLRALEARSGGRMTRHRQARLNRVCELATPHRDNALS